VSADIAHGETIFAYIPRPGDVLGNLPAKCEVISTYVSIGIADPNTGRSGETVFGEKYEDKLGRCRDRRYAR
jgi:hypothetical protein